uniref:Uncharacterized protein n=1 Tax=Panagrolaimus sp. JU765 TaxID=591449 RepID=A0AC34R1J4_9BILA
MNKAQVLRAYEILQLAVAEKAGAEAVVKYKECLLKRISKPYDRKTKEYKRMEAALSPEEMDLITANHGDNLTEEDKKKFRDDLMKLYRKTIEKLEKFSDKFGAFMNA